MKVLIFGHWSDTGFGVVTVELAQRFLAAGLDVRIIAVNHRGEPISGPLAGRVWPATIYGDGHGGNISEPAIAGTFWTTFDPADRWKPDVVLVVADMSGFSGHVGRRGYVGAWREVPVFHYCPIEGDNLPPKWRQAWALAQPVAMSDYGARIIGDFLGSAVPMIYHGVDGEVFHPVSPTSPLRVGDFRLTTKEQCRLAFGIEPGRLVILRTDRLVERKFYDRYIALLQRLFEARDDVDAVIHCRPQDPPLDLNDEIARLPADLRPRVKLTNAHDTFRGLTREGMAALMNAADLYVTTTGGEGFGLNLAESLACGVPVVTSGWAAEREVVGDGGVIVPPLHDSHGEVVRYHSQYGMDWAMPDVEAFVEPILGLLAKPSRRQSLGTIGRLHVRHSFSWDAAAASFIALFEDARVDAARVA